MTAKTLVLVIDDEAAIRKLLAASVQEGFELLEAETGSEGLRLIATRNPQIILLDLGLPDIDGIEMTSRIREFSQTPILVLSAREQERDKIAALDAGANDYLTKPFSIGELYARMRVALRSVQRPAGIANFSFGSVTINLATREVTKDGAAVHLTPIEFQLLTFLMRHAGKVLTHRQILTAVWGEAYARQTQYLRVFMRNLRHKLEEDPARPKFLTTETGIGYRIKIENL